MTSEQVIALIRILADAEGSQAKLANKLKVSKQHLSNVINGEREPGEIILRPLGLKRVVSYVKE